jgi:hypothetical protein
LISLARPSVSAGSPLPLVLLLPLLLLLTLVQVGPAQAHVRTLHPRLRAWLGGRWQPQ